MVGLRPGENGECDHSADIEHHNMHIQEIIMSPIYQCNEFMGVKKGGIDMDRSRQTLISCPDDFSLFGVRRKVSYFEPSRCLRTVLYMQGLDYQWLNSWARLLLDRTRKRPFVILGFLLLVVLVYYRTVETPSGDLLIRLLLQVFNQLENCQEKLGKKLWKCFKSCN